MATRKLKKVVETQAVVKTLNPRDVDQKYLGDEPIFAEQPVPEYRNSALARGLMWYHRFYGRKDARDMMAEYLDFHGRVVEGKTMRKVDDTEFKLPTFAWLGRMTMRGLELTEHETMALENEITRLLDLINKPQVKELSRFTTAAKTAVEIEKTKTNIQEIMREKAREAAGELEGMFDDFITAGCPTKHTLRPIDEVSKKNVLPQHVPGIREVWSKKLTEFTDLLTTKDSQSIQAYSHYSKQQIKNSIKFIELVLNDLNSYISVKKTAKAPRARKVIPVEKQVAKFKWVKVFKDVPSKLDLVSISPVKVHGASECYLYDTAKRKLIYICADEYSKTLSIKGNTILGIDSAKSQSKTIRKPGEFLKEFVKVGKPAGRKMFDEIKAVVTVPNGRGNDGILILKAW